MGSFFQIVVLGLCWLAALATLFFFLETWFALTGRKRFAGRRASGAYGVVTVFIPMQGPNDALARTIRSVLNQSYPFIELVLIASDENPSHAALIQEIRGMRTHISIRSVTVRSPLLSETDRIRALEQARPGVRGTWWVIQEPDILLDRLAIESALEFAGSNEMNAVALRPGKRCVSFMQRLLAPSMEYLGQMTRPARGRDRFDKVTRAAPFLLVRRQAFDVVNRINRMPGILNDAGWTIWSYQAEGLRIFEGDGARWLWREADIDAWLTSMRGQAHSAARSIGLIAASLVVSVITVCGLALGIGGSMEGWSQASIFAFSAISYALMTLSYFLYAHRLHGASWVAPFWFSVHVPAAILALVRLRRTVRHPASINGKGASQPRISLRF